METKRLYDQKLLLAEQRRQQKELQDKEEREERMRRAMEKAEQIEKAKEQAYLNNKKRVDAILDKRTQKCRTTKAT